MKLLALAAVWSLSWGIPLAALLTHRPDPLARPGQANAAAEARP